jgi:single-stranded DNA-binding protein
MSNVFQGKGNLATAPVLKTVRIGSEDHKVAEMRVFFDDYQYDEASGEYIQSGGFWMGVSLWDKRGEEAARLLRQGMRVKVEGRLREFEYKAEGTDKMVPGYQIIADEVTLCLNRIESIVAKPKREAAEKASA